MQTFKVKAKFCLGRPDTDFTFGLKRPKTVGETKAQFNSPLPAPDKKREIRRAADDTERGSPLRHM